MAFDYYLADSDSLDRVQIPEWFDVTDLRQEQRLVGGLIDYYDLSPVAVKPPTSGGGYKATHTVVRSR